MKTKILIAAFVLVGLWGCDDRYAQNDLELVVAYRAKALCTCLFSMEMDEEYCVAYSTQDPNVATYSIDYEKKVVTAQALLLWGDTARFVSDHYGCVLDEKQ